MEVMNYIPYIYQKFGIFVLIFTRISALFSVFILFRQDLVSPKVVIALSAILSLYVLLYSGQATVPSELFSASMLIQASLQALLGFIAGLVLNIMFEVISAFGQLLSMQIGLSVASLFDPKLGNITVLTHFYAFSLLLIFLLSNGHLLLIKLLLDSFYTMPVGHTFISSTIMHEVLQYSAVIFNGAITFSISIIIAILISNLALALLSKFAPQFNLFSVGINMTLIVGLIYVYITFDLFWEKGDSLIKSGMEFFQHLILKLG